MNLATACVKVLEEEGYAAVYAWHSGYALLACLSGVPADILITELSMADGLRAGPGRPAATLQPRFADPVSGESGMLYHAGNVLVRPFTGEDLLTRIRAAVTSLRAS